MKNRKREFCTSGSVRDEGGNILIYSAARERGVADLSWHDTGGNTAIWFMNGTTVSSAVKPRAYTVAPRRAPADRSKEIPQCSGSRKNS
jgi:hypothetical protein